MYGKELILDLHDCTKNKFTRDLIKEFFDNLCEKIDMQQCDLHFWDYKDEPEAYAKAPKHLKGISAVQFITTSNITIHTLDEMERVYLNIFSCKAFESHVVKELALLYFGGKLVNVTEVKRV